MAVDVNSSGKPFLRELIARGRLIPGGVPGVYGHDQIMADVVNRIEELATTVGRDASTEVMRFPPVISRKNLERSGYLQSFPHLIGSLHVFRGSHDRHLDLLRAVECGQDWGHHQELSDLVMTPAACYPVYPIMTGTLPPDGRLVDVDSYCFRAEPSEDPSRLQSFRMREFVRIGPENLVYSWREQWIARGVEFLESLGIACRVVPAADPFFGPGARLLAASQSEQGLKFELVTELATSDKPVAVMSMNYHRDHFGDLFEIRTSTGLVAHTACAAFGIDRLALALFSTHGLEPTDWPNPLRSRLWP